MIENQEMVNKITELILEELEKYQESKRMIPVGISARHVHLAKRELEILFGKGHQLTVSKSLSQPAQYAAMETVELIGPKGSLSKVRVLGPERPETQVEVSLSDARKLGLKPPVRLSGNLKESPGIRLKGPKGEVQLEQGVIIAKRHLHLATNEAKQFGLVEGDRIKVYIEGQRGGVMDEVVVRSGEGNALDLHIDTDDANAFGLVQGQLLRFKKIENKKA